MHKNVKSIKIMKRTKIKNFFSKTLRKTVAREGTRRRSLRDYFHDNIFLCCLFWFLQKITYVRFLCCIAIPVTTIHPCGSYQFPTAWETFFVIISYNLSFVRSKRQEISEKINCYCVY